MKQPVLTIPEWVDRRVESVAVPHKRRRGDIRPLIQAITRVDYRWYFVSTFLAFLVAFLVFLA